MTVDEKRMVIRNYCKSTRCDSCELLPSWCANYNKRTCPEPALDEALELIGYEQPDKEDSMSENKKPRLAEVLGVEVGEVFYISDYPTDYGPVAVGSDGKLRRVHGDGGRGNKVGANALYHLINQPECLSRRPRWTKQEVKDAKAIRRILPEARDIDRVTETMTVVRDEDGFCLLTLQKDMFPNVKEGQTVKLTDIIGGNT